MKKLILILFILVLPLLFIKIPEYIELNDLIIVDKIIINCSDKYYIYLREIIPTKEDNGLEYKYKFHEKSSNNLEKAFEKIKASHNIFIKDIAKIITNCEKDKLINLDRKYQKKLILKKDLYKEIKN